MPVYNLFSKRQQAAREEPSDFLIYDGLPDQLKVQIVHIMSDAFGSDTYGQSSNRIEKAYKFIHDALCREYGEFELNGSRDYEDKVHQFFLDEYDVEKALDVVDFAFRYLEKVVEPDYSYKNAVQRRIEPAEATAELNERFKQHSIGYRFESGEIIRVDSTFMHAEVVKPTLRLLHDSKFEGANEEYLKAHEHYRHGRNKECLADCLKAFESTMKIICAAKKWEFSAKDTSSALIKVCISNQLIPEYLLSQFTSLRSLLESGIPTIRNRIGGHGQGNIQTHADDETTRYALNLTGSNIIYLIELSDIRK